MFGLAMLAIAATVTGASKIKQDWIDAQNAAKYQERMKYEKPKEKPREETWGERREREALENRARRRAAMRRIFTNERR